MTKTKLAKLGITTLAAGAITLGAMTYFTGTDTIDSAKDTIIELGEKIGIYESNENKLISKINELNAELTILRAQEDETESLMLQISELENQIEELENQLLEVDSNGETLAERIILLESEVILANEKSRELQATIDENIVNDEPLTDLELAEITGEEIEQELDEIEEAPITDFSYILGEPTKEIPPGITLSSEYGYIQVTNKTGQSIRVIFGQKRSYTLGNKGSEKELNNSFENIVIEDPETKTVIATINTTK